jgi:regulator of sigma E protease
MARQGSLDFLWFIAILSTAVGFINLFPIPILDGGHLSLYAWEAVAGKPPSERILNRIMTVGLFIVLSFMIFAVTNDLFCP